MLTPFQKKVWAAAAAAVALSLACWVFWLLPAQQAKEYAGLMARSDAWMKEGKFAEAGEPCRRALEIRPNDTKAQACATKAAAEANAAVAIKWVTIPGGSFSMGSGNGDEGPVHSVTIKSFQMAKTLVTVAQYRACVDAGACTAPDGGAYCNFGVSGRADHPVNCVDWNQAKTFSKWVGGRLPSEAEWEYAARSAGKDWKYPWGDEAATCETAVISGCTSNGTAPVCSKPAGNTKQGLCDMAGNAWEWVQDWYHNSYEGAPTDGSAWESPTGSRRVIRGGSWGGGAGDARSAGRNSGAPGLRNDFLGFRPAR